jgi:hypothetical protein
MPASCIELQNSTCMVLTRDIPTTQNTCRSSDLFMMQAKSSAYGVSRNGRLSATHLYVLAAQLLNSHDAFQQST